MMPANPGKPPHRASYPKGFHPLSRLLSTRWRTQLWLFASCPPDVKLPTSHHPSALHLPTVMPQSLSSVYLHLVFSTKERRPCVRDQAIREEMHFSIGGISKNSIAHPSSSAGWKIMCIFLPAIAEPFPKRSGSRNSNEVPAFGSSNGIQSYQILRGRRDMGFSPSAPRMSMPLPNTSLAKKSIIGNKHSKMSSGPSCENTGSSGTSDMFGIKFGAKCGTCSSLPRRVRLAVKDVNLERINYRFEFIPQRNTSQSPRNPYPNGVRSIF